MKTVVITLGNSGSGKSTARKFFQSNGFTGFEASDYSKRIRIRDSRSAFEYFSQSENKTKVVEMISKSIDKSKNGKFVISGLRIPEEVFFLKKRYSKIVVIGIYAPELVSYERVAIRKSREKFPDLKSFYFRRLIEDYALGLAEVYHKYCDYIIDNITTESEFIQKLRIIVDRVNNE